MLDKELREQGPPDTADNTMLADYTVCPRKEYFFLRRLDYAEKPAYFTFGRAFGQGINVWHSTEDLELEERKFLAFAKAEEIWDKENPIEKTNDTRDNLINMIGLYMDLYPEHEVWKVIKPEVGFRLPIPGTNFYYAGSLDAYLLWPGYGILNREDKTTGAYFTQNFIDQWDYSTQVKGYQWAQKQIVEEDIFGTLMNMGSKRPQKDVTKRFSRTLVECDDWHLDRFMEETVDIMQRLEDEWRTWKWPKLGMRSPMNCAGGPGKSPCAYRRLCMLPVDPWEIDDEPFAFQQAGLIMKTEPWEPWEREGED